MIKWLKYILALIIIAFLLFYLAAHWQDLRIMLKLGPAQLALICLLLFLSVLLNARIVQYLTAALGTATAFGDMVALHHVALLLNYAPMKLGTFFRADYLKRHYGLSYTGFASFFLYVTFLTSAVAALTGLIVLLAFYGLKGYEGRILAAAFALTVAVSLSFLLVPLPLPKGEGLIKETLKKFLAGRRQISKEKKTIFTIAAISAATFILTAIRLAVIYNSMGKNIRPAGLLILGTLDFVVVLASLTPGSLGIREIVLGSSAVVLGVPLEVGILAAMIDRAVLIGYVFIAGGICASRLRSKYPADFKKE